MKFQIYEALAQPKVELINVMPAQPKSKPALGLPHPPQAGAQRTPWFVREPSPQGAGGALVGRWCWQDEVGVELLCDLINDWILKETNMKSKNNSSINIIDSYKYGNSILAPNSIDG